jgi:hypothetical protein
MHTFRLSDGTDSKRKKSGTTPSKGRGKSNTD